MRPYGTARETPVVGFHIRSELTAASKPSSEKTSPVGSSDMWTATSGHEIGALHSPSCAGAAMPEPLAATNDATAAASVARSSAVRRVVRSMAGEVLSLDRGGDVAASAMPLHGACESLGEVDGGPESEQPLGLARVGDAVTHVLVLAGQALVGDEVRP